MSDNHPPPVLYLTQMAAITWEQHDPGGCRCVCTIYHDQPGQYLGACLAAAEPGRLLRIVTPTSAGRTSDITESLQLCATCYAAIAPSAEPHHRSTDDSGTLQ